MVCVSQEFRSVCENFKTDVLPEFKKLSEEESHIPVLSDHSVQLSHLMCTAILYEKHNGGSAMYKTLWFMTSLILPTNLWRKYYFAKYTSDDTKAQRDWKICCRSPKLTTPSSGFQPKFSVHKNKCSTS